MFWPGTDSDPERRASSSLALPGEFAGNKSEPVAWHLARQKTLVGGRVPSEMAEAAINAIRNEQFYAIPAPELLRIVPARMEDIIEQRNPEVSLAPEIVALINEGREIATREPTA